MYREDYFIGNHVSSLSHEDRLNSITCCRDCWHCLMSRKGNAECIWYLSPLPRPDVQWCEHWNEDMRNN